MKTGVYTPTVPRVSTLVPFTKSSNYVEDNWMCMMNVVDLCIYMYVHVYACGSTQKTAETGSLCAILVNLTLLYSNQAVICSVV